MSAAIRQELWEWEETARRASTRRYYITKRFTDGNLEGLVYGEHTDVEFRAGERIAGGPYTGPGYVVESVQENDCAA